MDAEGDLDGVGAIGVDVDPAGLAVAAGRQLAQRGHAAGAAAVRAHHVPRQLEQAGPGRVQEHRQELVLVDAPGPGPLAHLDAPDLEVVGGGDELDQAADAVAVEALAVELGADGGDPGRGVGQKWRRRHRQHARRQRGELAIELGQHPAVAALERAEAELDRGRASRSANSTWSRDKRNSASVPGRMNRCWLASAAVSVARGSTTMSRPPRARSAFKRPFTSGAVMMLPLDASGLAPSASMQSVRSRSGTGMSS